MHYPVDSVIHLKNNSDQGQVVQSGVEVTQGLSQFWIQK